MDEGRQLLKVCHYLFLGDEKSRIHVFKKERNIV